MEFYFFPFTLVVLVTCGIFVQYYYDQLSIDAYDKATRLKMVNILSSKKDAPQVGVLLSGLVMPNK